MSKKIFLRRIVYVIIIKEFSNAHEIIYFEVSGDNAYKPQK